MLTMDKLKSYIFLSTAQIAFALNVICGKVLVEALPTLSFITIRFFFGALSLLFIMLLTKDQIFKNRKTSSLNKADIINIFLQAFSAGFLFNLIFYLGLDYTTATSAGIISSSLPGIIAIMAVLILKERLNKQKVFALFISICGILCISIDNTITVDGPRGSYLGDFLIFISLIPEAFYSVLNKRSANKLSPLFTAFIINILAFLLMLPIAFTQLKTVNFAHLIYSNVFFYLTLAGFCGALFFWLWPLGLLKVPASEAAIFGGIVPIACSIFAVLILNETFKVNDGLGLFCVVLSIYVSNAKFVKASKT